MRKLHTSNLRVVRDATGLTQQRFAARIGTLKASVENYEMGRAKLPDHLAARIGALTGVIPETLQEGKKLLNYNGTPFTAQTFQRWTTIGYGEYEVRPLMLVVQHYLETMLKAAIGPTLQNTPHLFRELLVDLNHFIFSRAERLELLPVIENAARANNPPKRIATTVGSLRQKFGDHSTWMKHDKKEWSDSTRASMVMLHCTPFEPFTKFGVKGGRPVFITFTSRSTETCDITIKGEHFRITSEQRTTHCLRDRNPAPVPSEVTPPYRQSSPARRRKSAESPKSSSPRRASRARGSGGKAS